jgi:hypothetical protein
MRIGQRRWILAVGLTLASTGAALSAQAPTPPQTPAPDRPENDLWLFDGKPVEVRAADKTWAAARIIRHEGRRYLIHRIGAPDDEWVWVHDMRPPPARPRRDAEGKPLFEHAEDRKAATALVRSDAVFKHADRTVMRKLDLEPAAGAKYVADAAPPAALLPERRRVELKGAQVATDSVARVRVPRANGSVVLVVHHARAGTRRIERLDLANDGASSTVFDLEGGMTLMDASPDGTRALFRADPSPHDVGNHLVVCRLEGPRAGPARELAFAPYPDDARFGAEIEQARFLDGEHLMTIGSFRTLIVWHLPTLKALWTYDLRLGDEVASSATGKYLAFQAGGRIRVVDSNAGRVVSTFASLDGIGGHLAFSPSGRTLVANDAAHVAAWDLTSGEFLREFYLPRAAGGRGLAMLDDRHALVGLGDLVDLERRLLLWSYRNAAPELAVGSGRVMGGVGECGVAASGQFWFVGRERLTTMRGFHAIRLPHAEALAIAQRVEPAYAHLLMPGTRVGLKVELPEGAAGVTAGMKECIAESGMVFDEAAPIRYVVTADVERQEQTFAPAGGGPGETAAVTCHNVRVRLLDEDGEIAWEHVARSGGHLDPIYVLRAGETVQQAVNAVAANATGPDLSFYKTLRLPRYVAKPSPLGYGTSWLTGRGLESAEERTRTPPKRKP